MGLEVFNYSVEGQINMFDYMSREIPLIKVKNHVRLIEMFGGVGSQNMALRDLGVDYESWKLIEYDKYPVASFNAIFGTDYKPMDIREVHAEDLEIVDRQNNTYICTYSFPCQDISVAGLGKSLEKGSGTRSGLLWEVERILNECGEELPQILLMENVKNLLSKKHKEHFDKWCEFLESKGYKNFYKVMCASDYGVAQHRERVFMVSLLGDYKYEFPKEIPLERRMKDYLEEKVDKRYYITSERAKTLIDKLILEGKILTNERTNERTQDY
ncbi:MAG: DNA (cytosine-5-)-methyltransferase [Bacteroidales bacterium]|nr:DNA (cytosine-5-)-methyltransferase [Bacteroidales bacterium]